MAIRIELKSELEEQLLAAAQDEGVPPQTLAERILREGMALRTSHSGVLNPEQLRTLLAAMAAGSEDLPSLATDTFTRESFYEGSA